MPGNPRALVIEAERRFPIRIAVMLPRGGLGWRYPMISDWLDDNCGVDGWSITSAGTRGVFNDAIAVYLNTPTCAAGFVARWLVPGDDPPGFYLVREDEPAKRVPTPDHSTPP